LFLLVLMVAKKITKKMKLDNVIAKHPEVIEILLKHGLYCVGCAFAVSETIEDGAKAHGASDKDIDVLIKELNDKIKKKNKEEK